MTKATIFFWVFLLTLSTFAQTTVDVKTANFRQTNETTINWELWMRKASGVDFGLHTFQAQWEFNTEILNNGSFTSGKFTVEAGGDAVFMDHFDSGDATVVGGTETEPDNRFSFVTTNLPSDGDLLTLITDEWKHIATFSAQLTKEGQVYKFANTEPEFVFRVDGAFFVFAAEETYSDDEEYNLDPPALFPNAGVPINDRQLSGYWFYGDGNWNNPENWNQTLKAANENYTQQIPGDNANVTINGNVIIPDGQHVTLAPSNKGGGEMTVLTGQEMLYTLTGSILHTGAGGIVNIWSDGVGSTNLGNPVDLAAGTTVTLQAIDFQGAQNVTWTTDPPESGSFGNPNATITTFTMPANDVEAIANMSFESNNAIRFTTGGSSPDNSKNKSQDLFASLTIAPTASLTLNRVYNDHEEQTDAIILQSDAIGTGSLIHDNEGVLATMERHFPGEELQWHLISSPVTGMSIAGSDFEPTNDDDFYIWHESGWWLNYKTGPGGNFYNYNPGFDFIPGRGYLAAYNPGKKGQVKRFRGEVTTGVVDIGLEYESPEPGEKADKKWEHEPGWNLIGNPFSAGIDWNTVLTHNSDLLEDNFAYVYDRDTNEDGLTEGYKPVDGTLADQVIAANQGFMVKVAGEAKHPFSFPPESRVHGGEFSKEQYGHPEHITLRIHNNQYFDETTLNLRPESHFERDRYDALKQFGYNDDIPQLYTMSEDNIRLSVNAIPFIEQELRIPMGVKFPATGEYNLRLVNATGQFNGMEIYLYDIIAGKTVLLSETEPYVFVAENSQNNTGSIRFEIRFTPEDETSLEETADEGTIRAWFHNNTLHVVTTENNTRIEVIDINGRSQKVFYQGKGQQAHPLQITAGVYIVRITGANNTETIRIIQQ